MIVKWGACLAAVGIGWLSTAVEAGTSCKIDKYGELQVAVSNDRAMLNARVNGQDAHFIIDSGAFYSSLTEESTARLGLSRDQLRSFIDVGGLGGRANVHQTSVKSFVIPGLAAATLKDVEFLVFGNGFAAEADGLIGENVLGVADTEYDLGNGVIRLMRSRGCDNTKMAYWTESPEFGMMALSGRTELKSLLVGHATLNGAPIDVIFDTGSPQSSLTLQAAARAGVTPSGTGVISGGTTHGVGPEVSETWIGRFQSLNIGGEEIKNLALRFGPRSFGSEGDMLLGLDFFRSHRIYVAKLQNRLFFTYNGGKLFDLSILRATEGGSRVPSAASNTSDTQDPTSLDVDGYRQRAAAHVSQQQYDQAIADYDHALALKPDDAKMFVARARLHLAIHDVPAASTDFQTAQQLSPHDSSLNLSIAYAYESNRAYPQAINEFNRWAQANPADERLPRVQHERCWCRAASNVELESALADCDAAIKHHNDDSQARINRGIVWLRLGASDKAIADFNEAIVKQPKSPWAFYGRALAELAKGDKLHAEQDKQAAIGLDATVEVQFRAIGLGTS